MVGVQLLATHVKGDYTHMVVCVLIRREILHPALGRGTKTTQARPSAFESSPG